MPFEIDYSWLTLFQPFRILAAMNTQQPTFLLNIKKRVNHFSTRFPADNHTRSLLSAAGFTWLLHTHKQTVGSHLQYFLPRYIITQIPYPLDISICSCLHYFCHYTRCTWSFTSFQQMPYLLLHYMQLASASLLSQDTSQSQSFSLFASFSTYCFHTCMIPFPSTYIHVLLSHTNTCNVVQHRDDAIQ